MKKILNLVLICSVLTISTTPTMAKGWFGKNKTKEKEKVEIVKPDNEKTNIKREIKRQGKCQTQMGILKRSRRDV